MVVVTGATGHVGNTLINQLLLNNETIRVLIRKTSSKEALNGNNIEIVEGDLLNLDSLIKAFTGVDVVFHCAALISILPRDKKLLYDINLKGTENVIEACFRCKVKRLVYTSSIEAIGLPEVGSCVDESYGFNPDKTMIIYGKTKALATLKVLEAVKKGLDAVIVCPTAVIGPNDHKPSKMGKMFIDFAKRKMSGYPDFGGFNFVDVRDIANGIILAAKNGKTGEHYLLTGEHKTVPELMDELEKGFGVKKPKMPIPYWLSYVGAVFIESISKVIGKAPIFTRSSIKIVKSNLQANGEKARKHLGYTSRPIQETIKDTHNWFKENGRV